MCGACVPWCTVMRCSPGFQSATTARGSLVTPVWRPKWKVVSITASAAAKPLSTSPASCLRSKQRLSPSSAWMTSVAASSAVSMSTTGGSSAYSIATSSAASSASARVRATTATTASPCQQARSMASGYCGADLMPLRCVSTPTHGVQTPASSGPVTTATTPGAFFAAAASMLLIRAWAWGERTNATCAMRGSTTSLTYCPRPCKSRPRLGRGTERPM